MRYTVTARGSQSYEVSDEQQVYIGSLDYTAWSPTKAQITTRDQYVYKVAGAGFWQTTRQVTREGLVYATLKPDWRGCMTLSFASGQSLLFKKKSLWRNGEYILMDDAGNEFAYVVSYFKWNIFGFSYEIELNTAALDHEATTLLPLLLIYAVKYLRLRHSAA